MKHLILLSICLTLVFNLAVIVPAWAVYPEQAKLIASDGAAWDYFGCSVSISTDYAIVGADADDDNGPASGSAYIFKQEDSNWTEQAKITASDGNDWDHFGGSVSIDGNYAIVGAEFNNEKGENAGAAYIFKREGEAWTQQAKLTASDSPAWDYFGCSVSISGDYVVIGTEQNKDCAYIFKREGTSWVEQTKLTAWDGSPGQWFAEYVAISGEYAIVSDWANNNENGPGAGAVYIFKRDGTGWIPSAKLIASDGNDYDNFGWSVAIDCNYAIAGAYQGGNGAAYIFKREGESWIEQAKLLASDAVGGDRFSLSVDINGSYATIGADCDDDNGTDSGSAYIFKRTGTNWKEYAKLTASDGAADDSFGNIISLSGNHVIVGACQDDDYGDSSGSAYIYDLTCPSADLTGDCYVNSKDFAILAGQWFQEPGVPSADIAPLSGGDNIVNTLDLRMLVGQWLDGIKPSDVIP